jgi:RluA family pseudouridine synthase
MISALKWMMRMKKTPKLEIPEIIFEDDDLIVINKPAGLRSIQDGYDPDLPHLRTLLEPDYGDVWIVHRLDKDTSGIILLARNAEAHRHLNKSFRERQVEKTYHGLVTPAPKWGQKNLNLPLRTNADRKHRTRVDTTNGKPAFTSFSVEKRFAFGVLMKIKIKSGITHQIRAHLRSIDLSLLGDVLYHAGLPEQPISVERTMLHAREISFIHPTQHNRMRFSANYPEDFRTAYTNLRLTTMTDLMI